MSRGGVRVRDLGELWDLGWEKSGMRGKKKDMAPAGVMSGNKWGEVG